MRAPLWTCQQMSKHCVERCHHSGPRNSKVCLLLAKWYWHSSGTLMGPCLSIIRIMEWWSIVHGVAQCLMRSSAICGKHRCMLSKEGVFHHDNAWPHMAAAIIEMVQKLKFELLLHPVYSPDLILFDYHTFWLVIHVLHRHKFANDKGVMDAFHKWLHA